MTLARSIRATAASCLLLAACAAPTGAGAERVRGPLPTRIHHPVSLLFPGPRPRTAQVLEPGAGRLDVDFGYSSIFEVESEPLRAASFDGEIARVGTRLAYGVADGFELVVEPAFIYGTSGFLDRIVDEFHAFMGFPGGGREDAPRDQYSMELRNDGITAYSMEEDTILFADLPVTLVARVREEDDAGPGIAARITIEIPTGDEDRGSGSGGWDTSAGVLFEGSIGRWTWTASADGVLVDQPDSFADAGITIRTLLLASGGLEYRLTNRTSLLLRLLLQTPLTGDLPFEEIDREILDIGVGLAHDLGRGSLLRLGFHEDAIAATGTDLTVYAGLSFGF